MELRIEKEFLAGLMRHGLQVRASKDNPRHRSRGFAIRAHDGVDFTATVGTSVHSMYNATVINVGGNDFDSRNADFISKDIDSKGNPTSSVSHGRNGCDYEANSYGKTMTLEVTIPQNEPAIKTLNGGETRHFYIFYAHLNEVFVSSGQVTRGQVISTTGCSGNAASGEEAEHHLHMETSTLQTSFESTTARDIDPLEVIKTKAK